MAGGRDREAGPARARAGLFVCALLPLAATAQVTATADYLARMDADGDGRVALLEYQDHKPFECVGEGRESRAALAALATRPEWREDALVERFVREILPTLDPDALAIAPQMALEGEHRVPPATWERVRAHFDA